MVKHKGLTEHVWSDDVIETVGAGVTGRAVPLAMEELCVYRHSVTQTV